MLFAVIICIKHLSFEVVTVLGVVKRNLFDGLGIGSVKQPFSPYPSYLKEDNT